MPGKYFQPFLHLFSFLSHYQQSFARAVFNNRAFKVSIFSMSYKLNFYVGQFLTRVISDLTETMMVAIKNLFESVADLVWETTSFVFRPNYREQFMISIKFLKCSNSSEEKWALPVRSLSFIGSFNSGDERSISSAKAVFEDWKLELGRVVLTSCDRIDDLWSSVQTIKPSLEGDEWRVMKREV